MKLITFVVPCYNSASYMRHCIDALLSGGGDIEILIVNDGSADETGEIADAYALSHPDIVRAIHQENGGHGDAVNTGLREAKGQFFKVVDSDDWLDGEAYKEYMRVLNELDGMLDLLITNYVYDKQGAKHKMVMRYGDACPKGRMFTWNDLRRFRPGEVLIMHALTYRTQLLRDCGIVLPRHTFYVDNLVAYLPLAFVRTIYYADIDLYRYFIGREGQSVNLSIMIKRQDQQLEVTRRMIMGCALGEIVNQKQRAYMLRYLEILMAITSILFIFDGSEAALDKKDGIWDCLQKTDPEVYKRIRHGIVGTFCAPRSKARMWIAKKAYAVCNFIYGFN